MAKVVTSQKHGKSSSVIDPIKLKTRHGLRIFDTHEYLSKRHAVIEALFTCLKEGDPSGFKEVLSSYLDVVNKKAFSKKAGISERTLFRMLTHEGNPTLDNIAHVFKVLSK